jgi:hypothetical protein
MSKLNQAQQQKWFDDYHHSVRSAIAGLIAGCGIYLIGGYSNTLLVRSACSLLATVSAYSVMQVRWITKSNQRILEASRDISTQATIDNLFLDTRPEQPLPPSAVNVEGISILSPGNEN